MRELDFPNELTSTQELADSQLPPAAAHPEVAVPIASAGDAQPESPPASPSDPEAFQEYFIRKHEGPPSTATLSETGFPPSEVNGGTSRPQPLTP